MTTNSAPSNLQPVAPIDFAVLGLHARFDHFVRDKHETTHTVGTAAALQT